MGSVFGGVSDTSKILLYLKYVAMRFIAYTQKGYRNLNGLQYPFNYI